MVGLGARCGTIVSGKWRIDRLLGRGGMAEVYAATHRNGKQAALKFLNREQLDKPGALRRFRREGYAANRIGHPAIVTINDDDVAEDGTPYLVLELLHGQTLETLRAERGGAQPLADVARWACELMTVMAIAHDRGVLHRDLKPANLFITRCGALKVLDFGIARCVGGPEAGETTLECVLGTPAYMSPEQARGRWDLVDVRSDVFSIGATLYTLLSGQPIHAAETRNEQLGLAMTAQAASLRGRARWVPDEIAAVVDRALRYEREERWPDVGEMQRAWARAVAAASSHADAARVAYRTPRWPLVLLAAAVLGLLCVPGPHTQPDVQRLHIGIGIPAGGWTSARISALTRPEPARPTIAVTAAKTRISPRSATLRARVEQPPPRTISAALPPWTSSAVSGLTDMRRIVAEQHATELDRRQ